MEFINSIIVISFLAIVLSSTSSALWSCQSDEACRTLAGSYCAEDGSCQCPIGQQGVSNGLLCADVPYDYLASCHNNYQCERLVSGYTCGAIETEVEPIDGRVCRCRDGLHYTKGRCWPSVGFGEECASSEECFDEKLSDINSMTCTETCQCSDGYYLRQRGECRKIGFEPGDGCTLNADCQFVNGACDYSTLQCYDTTVGVPEELTTSNNNLTLFDISLLGSTCNDNSECSSGLECSEYRQCICPVGYYNDGTQCLAHLGSPSSDELCSGLFAKVIDNECGCPPNFYYDKDMRNCIKATLSFEDACVTDSNCYTFGAAAYCGEPSEPWGFRNCECDTDISVKDEEQQMCRLFSALGEVCEVALDCMAGNVEVLCAADEEGVNRCTCPEGLEAVDGLCLTRGLELGDSCQVTEECTATDNLQCANSVCSCTQGYFENNGVCLPGIGGPCENDGDCTLTGTTCSQNGTNSVCQCSNYYVEYQEQCLEVSSGYDGICITDIQCSSVMGDGGLCLNGYCKCADSYVESSGLCFERRGLGSSCTSSGQCYVEPYPEYAVCRNDICQCNFDYPYDEDLGTCSYSSGARITFSGSLIMIMAFTYILVIFNDN